MKDVAKKKKQQVCYRAHAAACDSFGLANESQRCYAMPEQINITTTKRCDFAARSLYEVRWHHLASCVLPAGSVAIEAAVNGHVLCGANA